MVHPSRQLRQRGHPNLVIRTTGGNGDGIDIDSCRHVRIDGCDIASGDDCIAIKSGRGSEGHTLMRTTEDVHISNCTLADSIFACIGIGSETSGGIRNVRIERCRFVGAQTFAVYIKTRVGRGAFIEDISATDLDVSGVVGGFLRINALTSGLQDEAPVAGDEGIPTLRNFRFSNVRLVDCPVLVDATAIHPGKPLDGFTITGVTGPAGKGWRSPTSGTRRFGVITGVDGPLISTYNVTGRARKRRRAAGAASSRSGDGQPGAVSASVIAGIRRTSRSACLAGTSRRTFRSACTSQRHRLFRPHLELAVLQQLGLGQDLSARDLPNIRKEPRPPSLMLSVPSITPPADRSMSPGMRSKTALFEVSLITGAIALPIVLPRPVVNTTTVAPAATSAGVDSWS